MRKMIDYYERRAGNPSLDFIQRAAEALDVSVAELLGSQPKAARGKPGPPPHLQLRFDQIRRLPRKEQEFVICFIDTVLEKARRREVRILPLDTTATRAWEYSRLMLRSLQERAPCKRLSHER